MKTRINLFFSILVLLGVITTSCVKEPDEPVVIPASEITSGLTPNITIQGVKDLYATMQVVDATIKSFPDSNLVLEGVVISSDEKGNFYKQIYLQDATGSIMLSIDGTSLFNDYKLGQTLHIKLKGLNMDYDSWTEVPEIGLGLYDDDGTNKLGRIPATVLPEYLFKNKAPITLVPTALTLDNTSLTLDKVGKLVKIDNAQFIDSDTNSTYADAVGQISQNLYIQTCSGTSQIILRTSGYASFAGTAAPKGNGTITAVLTKYGSDYQLVINSNADVKFTGTRCGGNSGTGTGTGTKNDPYDVEHAISSNSGTSVWVTGFIVGAFFNDGSSTHSEFTAPFTVNYNVYIAASATETNTSNMLMVKLPSGDVRTATNLVDHANLLGSEIMYHGDLGSYNSVPGMINTNGYWLNGAGIDPDYVDPSLIFSQNFLTGLGSFTTLSVTGNQVWTASATYGAVMSGYVSADTTNYANEDWLISPAIDLTGKTSVKFNVNQAVNYLDDWANLKILATDNYTGDVATTTWTEISLTTKPAGSSWTFVQSEDYDFSAFDNKSAVVIAFKYVSSASAGSTWEIKQVNLK